MEAYSIKWHIMPPQRDVNKQYYSYRRAIAGSILVARADGI